VGDVPDTCTPADFPWHWNHRRKILAKNAEKSLPISEQSPMSQCCKPRCTVSNKKDHLASGFRLLILRRPGDKRYHEPLGNGRTRCRFAEGLIYLREDVSLSTSLSATLEHGQHLFMQQVYTISFSSADLEAAG
jgi:hypothetical protein